MKVLFIGGTGLISTAVSQLAWKKKIDLYILNRGNHNDKVSYKIKFLKADLYNEAEMVETLDGLYFDVIVQWIAFTEEHVKRDYRLFKEHTDQYVFISSASAYQKPLPFLPITEEMPLGNKYWEYSDNKRKCEEYLMSVHSEDFNVTIIRPSHTYNETSFAYQLHSYKSPYNMIDRILNEKRVILPDQGMEFWTLTYNMDFAHGFLDILGNKKTYGEAYHLTSDKVYSWERLHEAVCEALGKPTKVVYIPTDYILKHFPEFTGPILGDMNTSVIFDNSKIKKVAPNYKSETDFTKIVKQAVAYYLEHEELHIIDEEFNQRYDTLIEEYEKEFPPRPMAKLF